MTNTTKISLAIIGITGLAFSIYAINIKASNKNSLASQKIKNFDYECINKKKGYIRQLGEDRQCLVNGYLNSVLNESELK